MKISEKALRELVSEALENQSRGPVNVLAPKGPVVIDPVVAKDAAISDPVNPVFVPQDKQELQVALPGMVKGVEKSDVPALYRAIKDIINNIQSEETETEDMMKNVQPQLETIIRKQIRQIFSELAKAKKINEAPVKGTEDMLVGEPEPAQHDYEALYKALYNAVDQGDADELTDIILNDSENPQFMSDASDALQAMVDDDDTKAAARRLSNAMPGQIADIAIEFTDIVADKALTPKPIPPSFRGSRAAYTKTPEQLEQDKLRQASKAAAQSRTLANVSAETDIKGSSLTNQAKTARMKAILAFTWNMDKSGSDESMTLEQLSNIDVSTEVGPDTEFGWINTIIAYTILNDETPDWFEESESQVLKNLQKGYEIFAAAMEEYQHTASEEISQEYGEIYDISDDEILKIALGTDVFTGAENQNQPEHARFLRTFDEILGKYAAQSGVPRLGVDQKNVPNNLRSFLIYFGQAADQLFNRCKRVFDAAVAAKRQAEKNAEEVSNVPYVEPKIKG